MGGKKQLSVEVRGRQRVRNVALGVAAVLLLVTLLAASSRTWGTPSAAACLRARQVVQAAGLATVVALVLLGLRALELVLLPRHSRTARQQTRERWAGIAGVLGLAAGAVAVLGVGLAVTDTVRNPPGAAACSGAAIGPGAGAPIFGAGLLTLLVLVCGLVVWSVADLPSGDQPGHSVWERRLGEAGTAPEGTVICCSGGGIRSAAFCLGGLQALDSTPVPPGAAVTAGQDADGTGPPVPSIYAGAREVVAVSGGGYMAAAWHVARHPKPPGQHAPRRRRRLGRSVPVQGVPPEESLTLDADPELRPFGTASPELRRLRRNTAYLASSGAVRADAALSWFFGAVLMWAVTLAALGVTAWVLSLFVDRLDLATGLETPDAAAWPPRPLAAIVSALVVGLGPALFFGRRIMQMRMRRDARGQVPDAIQNTVLPALAVGTVVTALLIGVPGVAVLMHDLTVRNQPVPIVANVVHTLGFTPPSACEAATNDGTFTRLYQEEQARAQAAGHPVTFSFGACGSEVEVTADPKVGVAQVSAAARTALGFAPGVWQQLAASGAALALFGGLVRSMVKGRQQQPTGRGSGFLTFLRRRVAPWLATGLAVAAGFLLLVKWLDDDLLSLRQGGSDFVNGYWSPLAFLALLLLLKLGTSATWMSMHPYYRDRLRSAYLLRRTGKGGSDVEPVEDRDLEFADHAGEPDLVLCGTANLSDDELVPSGRQGAPFLFSARAIGFDDPSNLPAGGACPGPDYAETTRDVRISAAIAISGAALAPVMGRENKNVRPFRLVMALCNVRTGVWLPNPYWVPSISRGRRASAVRRVVTRLGQATGVPGVGAVLREGLGMTSLMSRSIYVTDGGQLENLGLVVALRSRPATVYVLDASGDPANTFSTLAQAMAMARIDSGVEFEGLNLAPLESDDHGYSGKAWATATIRYDTPGGPTGRLVYMKAAVPRGLTWDVEGYRKLDPAFPMTGTEDQLYGEFDFEAYRKLGWSVAQAAVRGRVGADADAEPDVDMPTPRIPAEGPVPGTSAP